MRKRTKVAISPGGGSQGPAGLRAWALALLVLTCTGAPHAARADTMVLQSGELVEGSIVHATRNTLVVRRAIGGMQQMPIQSIAEVRIDLAQGERISGQMLSWADGTYQIRSGGEVVRISKGRIVSRAPYRGEPAPTAPARLREERPVETAAPAVAADGVDGKAVAVERAAARMAAAAGAAARKASKSRSAALEASKPGAAGQSGAKGIADDGAAALRAPAAAAREASDRKPVALEASLEPAGNSLVSQRTRAVHRGIATPAVEVAAATEPDRGQPVALEASVDPAGNGVAGQKSRAINRGIAMPVAVAAAPEPEKDGQPVALEASVEPAGTGAGMVFRIELARPAEQTIVLIYGTVDGTARAGTDYEPQQGVITLAPGARSTQVRVPLIDRQRPRDESRFELFLTADPKLVNVIDQRITATIPGD